MTIIGDIALGALAMALALQEAQVGTPQEVPSEQDDIPPAEPDDGDEIVITGQLRGAVVGDVEPITTLDARDIQATGATNVSELLEALAPELGSARGRGGGRPVLLVDGRRISGFRELRDLPSEAIERVDILPEEVALKYGYRAEQRVVNFVLRENFFSTTAEMEFRAPTRGGRTGGELELDRLMLSPGKRTTFNIEYEHDGDILESDRDIVLEPIETSDGTIDPRPFRTLVGASESIQLGTVLKRGLGEASGTISAELAQSRSERLQGPAVATLSVPSGSPFGEGQEFDLLRDSGVSPLRRDNVTRSASLEGIVNSAPGDWRWSTNGSLNFSDSFTETDRGPDTRSFQADLDTLDPRIDPTAPFLFNSLGRDEARSRNFSAALDGLVGGDLLELPAGAVSTTLRGGTSYLSIDSENRIGSDEESIFLDRTRGFAAANIDVPLLEDSPIGDATLNANGEIETLSDFGTLTVYGGGLNWRPTGRLRLLGSFTREEGSPSLGQLGSPSIVDPETRIFDFTTGETVFVPVTSGGNPDLLADSRTVWNLGANWDVPMKDDDLDLTLRGNYVTTRTEDPIGGFPAITPAIEAAFPDRFVRDDLGALVSLDRTPVNFAEERRDVLRYGFTVSKRIAPNPPSPETIERFREMRQQRRAERGPGEGNQGPPTPPTGGEEQQQVRGETQQDDAGQSAQGEQATPQQGEQQAGQQRQQAQRGGGRRGGGARFGGSNGPRGGRLFASVTHEINFTDELLIAEGGPLLDYLDGEALSNRGGRSRHRVESRLGIFNNGWGARVGIDWYSATTVDSGAGQLRFDDYGTVDLRIFANLTEQLDLISKAPWLAGTTLRISVDNLLDERPRVTDPFGATPLGYQPALLEPEGRTISLQIRKLFVPRQFLREQFRRRRGG